MFKKAKALLAAVSLFALSVAGAHADEAQTLERAKVKAITATLAMPDGSELLVDMKFCLPGGTYEGVQAIVFGDQAAQVMQAGMGALHPELGDSVLRTWQNKAHPDDPRLPTYLLFKGTNENDKAISSAMSRSKEATRSLSPSSYPVVFAGCGSFIHPPNL